MSMIGVAIGASTLVGIGGAMLSANAQKDAASQAAAAQEAAAQTQANTSANIFNAQQVGNQPYRTAGGQALAQEEYLLGLNPNLDISGLTSIAQINPNLSTGQGGLNFVGPGGSTVNNELGLNGVPAGWGTPAGGSNAIGGYGMTNGVPTSSANGGVPSGNALTPLNNGWGGTTPTSQPFAGGPAMSTVGNPTNPNASAAGAPSGINPISGTPNTNMSGFGSMSTPYNPSTFFLSPDYQFQMGQGELALNKEQAASGGLYSTGALDNALKYATGLASQDYNQAFTNSITAQNQKFNMLNTIANGGLVATGATTAAGNTAAGNIGSAATGAGNASAAGAIGAGNAVSGAVNTGAGFVNNALNQFTNPSSSYNTNLNNQLTPIQTTATYLPTIPT